MIFVDPTGMAGDLTNGATINFKKDGSITNEQFWSAVIGYISNVMDVWGDKSSDGENHITFNVVGDDFSENDLGENGNLVHIGSFGDETSHVSGANQQIARINIDNISENTAAHEFGHHLGLSDRYLDGATWNPSSGDMTRKTTPLERNEVQDFLYDPQGNLYSSGDPYLTHYQIMIANSPAVEEDYQNNRGIIYKQYGNKTKRVHYQVSPGGKRVSGLKEGFGRGGT
ncbi:MAG: hypothetical protein AAF828_03580, partial [Bacteroidota bacterium]